MNIGSNITRLRAIHSRIQPILRHWVGTGPIGQNPKRFLLRAKDGAAAVEFAVISAVLLPMLFGLIAFSTTLYAMSAMQSAAAEAARRVAVGAAT